MKFTIETICTKTYYKTNHGGGYCYNISNIYSCKLGVKHNVVDRRAIDPVQNIKIEYNMYSSTTKQFLEIQRKFIIVFLQDIIKSVYSDVYSLSGMERETIVDLINNNNITKAIRMLIKNTKETNDNIICGNTTDDLWKLLKY